jgi:hypothetical protein
MLPDTDLGNLTMAQADQKLKKLRSNNLPSSETQDLEKRGRTIHLLQENF